MRDSSAGGRHGAAGSGHGRQVLGGILMGAADIVPGVSGATVAWLCGFYPQLIAALRRLDGAALGLLVRGRGSALVRHVDLWFLLRVGGGVVTGIALMTWGLRLPYWLAEHPQPVYGVFFGAIVAALVLLARSLDRLGAGERGWLLAGAAAGFGLANLGGMTLELGLAGTAAAGAVAICAMLLPGLSGSALLVLLGQYERVLTALHDFDLAVVGSFLLGIVAGALAFVRLLHWLIGRWWRQVEVAMTGLIAGALWRIWPFQHRAAPEPGSGEPGRWLGPAWPDALDGPTLLVLALALGSALLVALAYWLGRRSTPA